MAQHNREPGKDAVCFTAGPKGIPFSAGVIHAWLAADRAAPKVAAGISSGALSAAAFERACRERDDPSSQHDAESRRWIWFRRYLNAVTYEPLTAIWDSIPNPVDFFAEKQPVKDLSVGRLPRRYQVEEEVSRRHYYRLIKLGVWLAGLRITMRDVARCVVAKVRFSERYALWAWQWVYFQICRSYVFIKIVRHLCFSPLFILERRDPQAEEYEGPETSVWRHPRPLFGWWTWFGSCLLSINATYIALWLATEVADWVSKQPHLSGIREEAVKELNDHVPWLLAVAKPVYKWLHNSALADQVLIGSILLAVAVLVIALLNRDWLVQYLCEQLGVVDALLSPYSLRRKLFELFRDPANPKDDPKIPRGAMHLLLVAAPLEKIDGKHGKQVWFEPEAAPIVDALAGALSLPGLYPPVRPHGTKPWIAGTLPPDLRLIDGALVRQNPLPALFDWLKTQPAVAQSLCGASPDDTGIHLVYNVPVRPGATEPDAKPRESINIVNAAFSSLELAKRRDSRMEWRQTNFISLVEWAIQQGSNGAPQPPPAKADEVEKVEQELAKFRSRDTVWPIFADEIAPDREIRLQDGLAPGREQLLSITAQGCRATLQTLYPETLTQIAANQNDSSEVHCLRLLSQIAPQRAPFMSIETPGLPEVCRQCSGKLQARSEPVGEPTPTSPREFRHLGRSARPQDPPPKPRIVFLAAGGVFRGAFHIGVVGAMQAAKIRPDLIVGASVGTLMGGALGAISTSGCQESLRLLGQLSLTFLNVDQRVALTKTLKNAAKQLSTRAAGIRLSPASLRKSVRRGASADTGYAVTGAPPALIDALSTLFLIPHEDTASIAAEFVAGHITKAMSKFWKKVQEETLARLEIECALMGTSLIEDTARGLFGHPEVSLDQRQPYHRGAKEDHWVSVFGTASDLNASRGLVLPRDLPQEGSYSFLHAGLSSSAFPVVFSARQEADILPGRGATNHLYADGGMFDNLPFFPAIEVLASVQSQLRKDSTKDARDSLRERLVTPDLFLAASLESAPTDQKIPNFLAVREQAAKLNVNVKLNSFCQNAELVAGQTYALLDSWAGKDIPAAVEKLMDEIVPAAVLKVTPTNSAHLNNTFAFCKSLGFEQDKVAKSIADGCFRTFESLVAARQEEEGSSVLTQIAVRGLHRTKQIPEISRRKEGHSPRGTCPFFQIQGKTFDCPFVKASRLPNLEGKKDKDELSSIFEACQGDKDHIALHKAGVKRKQLAK